MRKGSLIFLAAVAMLAGGQPVYILGASSSSRPAESPSVEEIASRYLTYRKMTPTDVPVNLEFIADCAGMVSEEKELEIHGPHSGASILIYMNDAAAKIYEAREDAFESYPVGAVIVKHKLIYRPPTRGTGQNVQPGSTGIGGMVKRAPGYDPPGGDWEYFYFTDPESIEAGRIETCAGCHRAAKERDFVFGEWGG